MTYNFCAQALSVVLAALMIVVITATASPEIIFANGLSLPKEGSDFRVVALEGDAAPADLGGTYSKIVASSISNSGDVVFSANLAGSSVDSAIIRISEDETRAFLRSGELSPGGGRHKTFGDLDFARLTFMEKEGTYLLFRAEIEGGSACLLPPDGRIHSIVLKLIGGNTGNERVPVLRTFSGVKFSDRGTLLLRGSVGEGSATQEGLFLLHRLFEPKP